MAYTSETLPCMIAFALDHVAAERLADRLVAEADAEDRQIRGRLALGDPGRCPLRSACMGRATG